MKDTYADIAKDIISDRRVKLGILHKEDVNEEVWKELCILLRDQNYAVDLAVNGEIVEWEFLGTDMDDDSDRVAEERNEAESRDLDRQADIHINGY